MTTRGQYLRSPYPLGKVELVSNRRFIKSHTGVRIYPKTFELIPLLSDPLEKASAGE